MFKKTTMGALGLSLMCTGLNAVAENYVGGNFAFVEYSIDGLDDDASLTAIYGRLGTEFNENFSGEIRLGIGVGDDDVNVLGTPVTVELNSLYGAYVRGGVPVSEQFFPYAVLGYTRGEAEASGPGGSIDESDSDVSFGVGADIAFSDQLSLNIEYMNWYDKDGAELSGFTFGLVSKF